jgi:hypothetical protein
MIRTALPPSWDFGVFRQYVIDGAETPKNLEIRQQQAGHDARMAGALKDFLSQDPPPKLAGLMGGHGLARTNKAYEDVVRLAQRLVEEGYIVVSGGGPGAMEAAHVGATFATLCCHRFSGTQDPCYKKLDTSRIAGPRSNWIYYEPNLLDGGPGLGGLPPAGLRAVRQN